MSERIYYQAPYQVEFEADIISQTPVEDGFQVVLDRTCFYPGGGGQPADSGEIDGRPVLSVFEKDDVIVHLLPQALPGPRVVGRIDWTRRFDHMQQHTGQHILSAAFEKLYGARTVGGFHLGAEFSTIDLDWTDLTRSEVDRIEDLANQVVMENRPVISRFYASRAEIEDTRLRNMPVVEGPIRIIEVAGFDICPCGGTHVHATGEVGPIKVIGWERSRGLSRVRFLCGRRALADYRLKSELVRHLADRFTVGEREVLDAVARLVAEQETTRRQCSALRDKVLDLEAEGLVARAGVAGVRIIRQAFTGREAQEVRGLAQRIVAHEQTVVLLGLATEPAQLVFARSADVDIDIGQILAEVCRAFGGRGGGRAHWAQGGGFPASALDEALRMAMEKVEFLLS